MSIDTQNKLLNGAGLQKAFELLKNKLSSGYVAKTSVVPNLYTGVNIGSIDGKDFYAPMAGEAPDLSGYVPSTRTINGQALTTNITLTASDVGVQFIPTLTEGNPIGDLTLNGTTTTLYAPVVSAPSFTYSSNISSAVTLTVGTLSYGVDEFNIEIPGDYITAEALTPYALSSEIPEIPTNVSEFTNDVGYITASDVSIPVTSVNGETGDVVIPVPSISVTQGLTSGVTIGVVSIDNVDTELYAPNPITSLDWSQITNAPSMPTAPVAFSGDYDDLTNTPVGLSYFQNDEGYITAGDISYTPAQTTGITLGYLDVIAADGSTNSYSIYAPSVTVTQTLVSGTEIGSVNGTTLYAPAPAQNNIQVYEISYDSQQSKYVLSNDITYNDIDHDITYNNIPILRMTGSGLNEMFYLSGHTASTIYFRNISLQNMAEIAISESGQDTVITVTNLGINVNGITIVIPADTHTAIN